MGRVTILAAILALALSPEPGPLQGLVQGSSQAASVVEPRPIPGICRGDVCLHLVERQADRMIRTQIYVRNSGIESRTVFAHIQSRKTHRDPDVFLLRGDSYQSITIVDGAPKELDIAFWHKRGVMESLVQPSPYQLPIPPTYAYQITQQPGKATTHALWEINAHDFSVPIGTPILAARSGIVIESKHDSTQTCRRPIESCYRSANYLVIEHDDATVAYYVHLAHDSIVVKTGERVAMGQHIASSGNTGYSTGPHLHFDVVALSARLERMSLSVTFEPRS